MNNNKKDTYTNGEGPHEHSIRKTRDLVNKPPRVGLFSARLSRIGREFDKGFNFINKYGLAASFFGSARSGLKDRIYQEATKLASLLVKEDFTIITGGGPGIMEAANKGAYEAGGESVGLTIQLPGEQVTNRYVKDSLSFHYFFSRKVMLSFASEVYVFFPGGFGTMDEFFEMITLIQTGKDENILVVLVGEDYWSGLLSWIKETVYEKNSAISEEDMSIYNLVDTADEAYEIIKEEIEKRPNFFSNNK